MKKEKQALVNLTLRAKMQKAGLAFDEQFVSAESDFNSYVTSLALDNTRTDSWKSLQRSVKAQKTLEGLSNLIVSNMSEIQGKYDTLQAAVTREFETKGGVDAMVLTNALGVITSAKMPLTQIIASKDMDLLRAVKVMPAGRYLVANTTEKMDMVDDAIAKLLLGADNYAERNTLNNKLQVMAEFTGVLQKDASQHKTISDTIANNMVEAA